jgi:hypothetical protein
MNTYKPNRYGIGRTFDAIRTTPDSWGDSCCQVRGKKPKDIETNWPKAEQSLKQLTYSVQTHVTPIFYGKLALDPYTIVRFSNGSSVQKKYFDWVIRTFKDVTWKAGQEMIAAYRRGRIVAVVMCIRKTYYEDRNTVQIQGAIL